MRIMIALAVFLIVPAALGAKPAANNVQREAQLDELMDCLEEVLRAELDPTVSNEAFQGLIERLRTIASQFNPPLAPGERGFGGTLEELDSITKSHAELLSDPRVNLTDEELDCSYHKAAVKELTEIVARLRRSAGDATVPYVVFQLDVWKLVTSRHNSNQPVIFRELGTSRPEIRRLVAEKRHRHPEEYKKDSPRDREVDAYLTTTEPDFVR